MSLKNQILSDTTTALKSQDKDRVSALRNLKAKITEAEKKTGIQDLSDKEVMKVIISSVKQRKDSIDQFEKANRNDLVEKEAIELAILESYLPKKLSLDEVRAEIDSIVRTFSPITEKNLKMVTGKTIGELNKRYPGQIDMELVKTELSKLEIVVE